MCQCEPPKPLLPYELESCLYNESKIAHQPLTADCGKGGHRNVHHTAGLTAEKRKVLLAVIYWSILAKYQLNNSRELYFPNLLPSLPLLGIFWLVCFCK